MVECAVRSAGVSALVDVTLSIEDAGIYKPHPRVYRLVTERLGVAADEVSFQSSNPWDAAGAGVFGFRVVWVNRTGQPREYAGALGFPLTEVGSLSELPAILKRSNEA
jgi:2-haloacid dehalogenase